MRAVWTTTGPLDRPGPPARRAGRAQSRPLAHPRGQRQRAAGGTAPRGCVAGHLRSRAAQPVAGRSLRAARDAAPDAPASWSATCPSPGASCWPALRAPGGGALVVGCVHCHNARHPEVVGREIARAAETVREAAGDDPAVLAGDLERPPGPRRRSPPSPAEGWHGATARRRGSGSTASSPGGSGVVDGPRALPPAEREVDGRVGGRARRRAPVRPRPRGRDPRARAPYGERIVSWATSSAITTTAAAGPPGRRGPARPRASRPSGHMSGNASRPKRAIDVIVPLESGQRDGRPPSRRPRGSADPPSLRQRRASSQR